MGNELRLLSWPILSCWLCEIHCQQVETLLSWLTFKFYFIEIR